MIKSLLYIVYLQYHTSRHTGRQSAYDTPSTASRAPSHPRGYTPTLHTEQSPAPSAAYGARDQVRHVWEPGGESFIVQW